MSETQEPDTQAPPDGEPVVITQAMYDKALADSDRREGAARKAQARAAELELELEQARKPTEAARPPSKAPDWFNEYQATQEKRFAAQEERFDALANENSARTRAQQIDALIADVPEANRGAAKLMAKGLEAQGIDLGSADAATALQRHTSLFVDHERGAPRRAPTRGPDGKISFDGMSINDIPGELMGEAFSDPKTSERLLRETGAGSTGRTDGHTI